jgi:hypothetical protein
MINIWNVTIALFHKKMDMCVQFIIHVHLIEKRLYMFSLNKAYIPAFHKQVLGVNIFHIGVREDPVPFGQWS